LDLGLRAILSQKGDRISNDHYTSLVANAQSKLYAIGFTNNEFTDKHLPCIKELLTTTPALDVVISFWNPFANVQIEPIELPGYSTQTVTSTPCVQSFSTLTGRSREIAQVRDEVGNRIGQIIKDVEILKSNALLKGRLRIMLLAVPINISGMIIDDAVLFSPYLVGEQSHNCPMFRFEVGRSESDVAKRLYQHFDNLVNKSPSPERITIYDSRATNN
jgi:hypothetical protein